MGTVRAMAELGPLWSARHGRGPALTPLTTADLSDMFVSVVRDLFHKEHLQEAFGKDCPDDREAHGTLGPNPEEQILLQTGHRSLYPVWDHYTGWDQDTLLDAVELYGQLVSSGDPHHPDSWDHNYDACGWHYGAFNREPAFSEYRATINKLLARYESGFELNSEGMVQRLGPPEVDELAQPPSGSHPLSPRDEQLVQEAIAKFKSRNPDDRRAALKNLADVLEHLQKLAPGLLVKADEKALFLIANRFWIRHNDLDQYSDYDYDIWWDWVFHMDLAGIRLIQRLQRRHAEQDDGPAALALDIRGSIWRKGQLAGRLREMELATLTEEHQWHLGAAVGRRSVGGTMVVAADGLRACAASSRLDEWPAEYRLGLLECLFLDEDGQVSTQPGLMTSAVRLLEPLPDHVERLEAFIDRAVKATFSVELANPRVRGPVVEALREAAHHLGPGPVRDAWLRLADRFGESL